MSSSEKDKKWEHIIMDHLNGRGVPHLFCADCSDSSRNRNFGNIPWRRYFDFLSQISGYSWYLVRVIVRNEAWCPVPTSRAEYCVLASTMFNWPLNLLTLMLIFLCNNVVNLLRKYSPVVHNPVCCSMLPSAWWFQPRQLRLLSCCRGSDSCLFRHQICRQHN